MKEGQRLFSEAETKRILKRATEIQAESGAQEGYGLTEAELQQIAREVGIEPQALAAAVAELDAPGAPSFRLLGGPVTVRLERVVAGELTEEKREAMLEEIRRTFHLTGAAGQVGRTLEWTYSGRSEQAQVTITARQGQIRIQVLQHFPKLAILSFVPALSITVSLLPAFVAASGLGPLFALMLGLSIVFGVFLAARFAFASLSHSKERKAKDLLHRLEQIAATPGEGAAAGKQPLAAGAAEPVRFDLDADAVSPERGRDGVRARTSS